MLFKIRVPLVIPQKGADPHALQSLSSTQEVQVGVSRLDTPVSPLSLWERVRVRGF